MNHVLFQPKSAPFDPNKKRLYRVTDVLNLEQINRISDAWVKSKGRPYYDVALEYIKADWSISAKMAERQIKPEDFARSLEIALS